MTIYLKDEGLDTQGRLFGPLTYEDGKPIYSDGRWVIYPEAEKIANQLKAELFII